MTIHKYVSEYVNPTGDNPNVPEVHDYDRTKPNQPIVLGLEHFKTFTYCTYRYDIGTRQHYLNARNKAEALEKFRSDYGPRVRSIHVHRSDWAGWHS